MVKLMMSRKGILLMCPLGNQSNISFTFKTDFSSLTGAGAQFSNLSDFSGRNAFFTAIQSITGTGPGFQGLISGCV